jgi:hypothetical protein
MKIKPSFHDDTTWMKKECDYCERLFLKDAWETTGSKNGHLYNIFWCSEDCYFKSEIFKEINEKLKGLNDNK